MLLNLGSILLIVTTLNALPPPPVEGTAAPDAAEAVAGEPADGGAPVSTESLPQPAESAPLSADAGSPQPVTAPAPEEDAGSPPRTDDSTPTDLSTTALDDLSLEQLLSLVVVTATKTERTAETTPAAVSIVTREQIEKWGYSKVADLLQHLTGFYLVDDHILPNVGVRGIAGGFLDESSSIKLLINGTAVAYRATSGNWLGAELVPMSAVERVEVIRGPASALYGADAFLGVVNIILRSGEKLSGADLRGAGLANGDRFGSDLDACIGGKAGPVDFLVAGRLSDEDRSGIAMPDSSPAPTIPSYRKDRTASELKLGSRTGLARFVYSAGKGSEITLFGSISQLDRGAEFSPWLQLSNGVDGLGRQSQTLISLYQGHAGMSAHLPISDRLKLEARAVWFRGGTGDDHIEVGSDIFYVRRKFGFQGFEASLEGRWDIRQALTAVVGAEYNLDRELLPSGRQVLKLDTGDFRAGDVLNADTADRGLKNLVNIGAFAQMLWSPIERWLDLTGGIRWDNQNIYGNQLSERVAVISSPLKGLTLKLVYGNAFKAPSPMLLHAVPYRVGDVIGNPDLKPQYVHSVEGQVVQTLSKVARVTTGLAYTLVLNKAEFAQQGVNLFARNLARVESLSWETELIAQFSDRLSGYASFELLRTRRDLGAEGYLSQLLGTGNVVYPPYLLRFGITGELPFAPLQPALEGIVAGPRNATEMNSLDRGAAYVLPPYLMLDASVSTHGLKLVADHKTFLMLKVRNLLATSGPDPGYAGVDYPLAPRTVVLQIRQEL